MPETDLLGAPYTCETLQLRPDVEGEVVATLVHRPAETASETSTGGRKAVLHVHGFCDYFFQTVAADVWVRRGYDFYALDLRKYGRSLRPHQTPNYVADLRTHYEELDLAFERVIGAARPRGLLGALDGWAHRAAVAARPGTPGGGVFRTRPGWTCTATRSPACWRCRRSTGSDCCGRCERSREM